MARIDVYKRQLLGPKKHGIVAFENSFHGRTMGALSVTSNPKYRTPFGDLVPGTSFLNIHDELSVPVSYTHLDVYKRQQ